MNVAIERVTWDSLAVDLGESARDGIVAPGAEVPVNVAYNILWPESGDVAVRVSARLRSARGGEVLWRFELREVVPANLLEPPARVWSIRAPRAEGTYFLEVRASWEPAVNREGSRLGRLIRRRKPVTVASSAVRKVAFTVLDPATRQPALSSEAHSREIEVDSIDLTRSRSLRPLAAGRSGAAEPGRFAWPVPPEALIEPSRRDRVRGWIIAHRRRGREARTRRCLGDGLVGHRPQGITSRSDPPPHAQGQGWRAVGSERGPHRIRRRRPRPAPRLLLDACASGPPILADGPPATFTWLVWPSSNEMVLVLVNRSEDAQVGLGTVALAELDDVPPASASPEPDPAAARRSACTWTDRNASSRSKVRPARTTP